jgi:predicted ester cyclase
MRPLILLILCTISTYSFSQNALKSTSQSYLEAAHAVNKAFVTGDISKIDDAVAADFVDHSDRGDFGRDSLKAMIKTMHQQFPDMKAEIITESVNDNYVFMLMQTSGTSNGEMGIPKGPFIMQAIELLRFNKGKIVEHWSYMELRDIMKIISQQK